MRIGRETKLGLTPASRATVERMSFAGLVSQYVEHYHTERPHQAKGNVPLTGEWPEHEGGPHDPDTIVRRTRLCGLLKHYQRRAAEAQPNLWIGIETGWGDLRRSLPDWRSD